MGAASRAPSIILHSLSHYTCLLQYGINEQQYIMVLVFPHQSTMVVQVDIDENNMKWCQYNYVFQKYDSNITAVKSLSIITVLILKFLLCMWM